MKKNKMKLIIACGVICVFLMAVSTWYTITFNGSRLLLPTNLSAYTFRMQDLPMICSGILFAVYILYLLWFLVRAILTNNRKKRTAQTTRRVNPRLGFLGFLGLLGFFGFWTYNVDKTIFPFMFFMFFGFWGFFYEGKMSNTFMDERYKENRIHAELTANKISLSIVFIAILIFGQGKLMGSLEYTLIAIVVVVSFSIALKIFLSEYLLYHYDHDNRSDKIGR